MSPLQIKEHFSDGQELKPQKPKVDFPVKPAQLLAGKPVLPSVANTVSITVRRRWRQSEDGVTSRPVGGDIWRG